MTTLHQWARRWGVTPEALDDLRRLLTDANAPVHPHAEPGSEAGAQVQVRLAASRAGIANWRNNVGALSDTDGRFVRYGLANDTPAMNANVKSADLVGIRPVVITGAMVGATLGQFWCREIKRPGWRWPRTPSKRELAQLAWAELVVAHGGDAGFATGGEGI